MSTDGNDRWRFCAHVFVIAENMRLCAELRGCPCPIVDHNQPTVVRPMKVQFKDPKAFYVMLVQGLARVGVSEAPNGTSSMRPASLRQEMKAEKSSAHNKAGRAGQSDSLSRRSSPNGAKELPSAEGKLQTPRLSQNVFSLS